VKISGEVLREWGVWDFKFDRYMNLVGDTYPQAFTLKEVEETAIFLNEGQKLTDMPRVNRAKTIKQFLRKAYPGVKFSVKSDSFSGGQSIDVDWTDGPSVPEVQAITNQFKVGLGEGSHHYLFENRKWSEERRQLVEDEIRRTHAMNFDNDWKEKMFIQENTWRVFVNTSFYRKEGFKVDGISWNQYHKALIWAEDKEPIKDCKKCANTPSPKPACRESAECPFQGIQKLYDDKMKPGSGWTSVIQK